MSDGLLFECHDLEEHAQALANFLPNGRLFEAKNIRDSLMRQFLRGLAHINVEVEEFLKLFDEEIDIANTTAFLEPWEATVGIPDDCFSIDNLTLEQRRQQVLLKLAALGVQTEQDFINLAALFGVDIEIRSGVEHFAFPFFFPLIFFNNIKESRFTMIIIYDDPAANVFPLTFPILFGGATIPIIECLFRKLVPANVDLYFLQQNQPPTPAPPAAFGLGFSDGFS